MFTTEEARNILRIDGSDNDGEIEALEEHQERFFSSTHKDTLPSVPIP